MLLGGSLVRAEATALGTLMVTEGLVRKTYSEKENVETIELVLPPPKKEEPSIVKKENC